MESKEGSAIALYYGSEKNLNLRYGISFISAEQAKKNLQRDITTYDVKAVADAGRRIWNKTLGKIVIEGGSEDEKEIFYTSLYRTYERMINLSEDGNITVLSMARFMKMAEYLFIQMTGYGYLPGYTSVAYLDRTAEGTRYDSFIYTDGRTVGQKMDAYLPRGDRRQSPDEWQSCSGSYLGCLLQRIERL